MVLRDVMYACVMLCFMSYDLTHFPVMTVLL